MSSYDDSNPEECEFCAWETTALTKTDAYARTPGQGPFTPDEEKEWAWLCDVCRSTPAGNAHLYPRQRQLADIEVLQTVAWGINYIASLTRDVTP